MGLDLLYKMDDKWIGSHNTAKFGDIFRQELKMKPSDYFHRNCARSPSTPGPEDIDRRARGGRRELAVGQRPPPPRGHVPVHRYWIRERLHDVPVEETRMMLGENAAALYGVDRDALAPLVAEIGPTLDEVHGDTPIEPAPTF